MIRTPSGVTEKELKLSQMIGKHLDTAFQFVLIWMRKYVSMKCE